MSPRDRFSLVGHAAMPFMNPLTEAELLALVAPAGLTAGSRTLDLGGGRADLSRLLAERFGCAATSVDASPGATEAAAARTRHLGVALHTLDAQTYLARERPTGLALVSVVGAVHAFGEALGGWRAARAALRPVATHALFAELVATGPRAVEAFGVARAADVEALFAGETRASTRLGPDRVLAYERAWCAGLAAFLEAHPGDPREAWARERIAWTEAPALRAARVELEFRAWLARD